MHSAFDLSGQRILITGATGGIGASTARVCAALGAELVLIDQRPAEALVAELGGAVVGHHLCDVSVRAEIEAIVAGSDPIDAFVAAAAICPWDDWQEPGWDEAFEQVMAVNVLGALHGARACLPGMIERRHGRIVLVGSVAGRMGGVLASAHYVASKGGLHALVKWLAQRGAPYGVLVNGIAPAIIDTAMTRSQPLDTSLIPLDRKGRPDEVAWPIAFLCSEAASYICGSVLDVNGGLYMT